ncbi:MAG: hypothetical protein DRR19_13915 [Candidatus Parabeggiatoa sp. nov. 1]|nr:MAG: hypothetical protein DRR19_13915 [Gammaproteobacteria bacterium]
MRAVFWNLGFTWTVVLRKLFAATSLGVQESTNSEKEMAEKTMNVPNGPNCQTDCDNFLSVSAEPRWLIAALVPALCGLSIEAIAMWALVIVAGATVTSWQRGPGEPPAHLSLQWIALSVFATSYAHLPLHAPAASGTLAADWRSCLLTVCVGVVLGLMPLSGAMLETGTLLILAAFILPIFRLKNTT